MNYTKEELERFCAILQSLTNDIKPMRSGKHMKSTVYNMDGNDIEVLIKFKEFYDETSLALKQVV